MMIINHKKTCPDCGGFGDGQICAGCGLIVDEWVGAIERDTLYKVEGPTGRHYCLGVTLLNYVRNENKDYMPQEESEFMVSACLWLEEKGFEWRPFSFIP